MKEAELKVDLAVMGDEVIGTIQTTNNLSTKAGLRRGTKYE